MCGKVAEEWGKREGGAERKKKASVASKLERRERRVLSFSSYAFYSPAQKKKGNFLIATPDLAPPAGSEAEQVALGADEEEAAASDTAGTAKLSGGRKG